jgi:hemoglobin/transferrin/lactoferrin receptor protein
MKAMYKFGDNFILTAGVENILDIRYRPYSSGIVAPGRNFIVGIKMFSNISDALFRTYGG